MGLGFFPLLITNFAWIFFWLPFKRTFALISGFAVLLAASNISNHFGFRPCNSRNEGNFSVMTFNVKVFNLYDWTRKIASKDAILRLIADANPDIVCLQEFYTDDSEQFNTIALLKKNYPYFHFQKTLTLKMHNHWGIVTFSKHPIIKRDTIIFNNSQHNLAIVSDIVLDNDTIRVFNAHLQSIYLGPEEFEGMRHLEKGKEFEFIFFAASQQDA